MSSLTLLLVDDHKLFRSGLKQLIVEFGLFSKILEADHGDDAIENIKKHSVDLMLLDIDMPVMDGISVIKYLRKSHNLPRTIMLTIYNDPARVYQLIKLGANGYLPKNCDEGILLEAIRTVLRGGVYYPNEYEEKIKTLLHSGQIPGINLSSDELGIIKLIARGLTSKEIASLTGYTVRTVDTKKSRLKKKLIAKSSGEVVHVAYRLGFL